MRWLLVALLLTGCQAISELGFAARERIAQDGIPIITFLTIHF